MSTYTAPIKDPVALLDYTIDWGDASDSWLADGETITGTPVLDASTGVTLSNPTVTGGAVTFNISGGTAGTSYVVGVRITTSEGRTDRRSFTLKVEDR